MTQFIIFIFEGLYSVLMFIIKIWPFYALCLMVFFSSNIFKTKKGQQDR